MSDDYTGEQREEIINAVKAELSAMENAQTAQAIQFADVLLQNIELGRSISDPNLVTSLRDKLMAQNVMWILEQEEARGNSRIFISAHNGHMEQEGYYDTENKVMGTILEHEIGEEAYFAIGTDFYKTKNNMPNGKNGRTTLTVFSTDPLANAAKKCGYDTCWLDFSEVPEDSALNPQITDYCYMGNLGENQMNFLGKAIMRAVPYTYRVWRSPSTTYDGMIFVTNAHPITVED